MKLLECKDKLTINELLQIAFEYGNDNADMPADSESITESFNEWIKSNDDLFKKLILPHVSNNEVAVCDHKIIKKGFHKGRCACGLFKEKQ